MTYPLQHPAPDGPPGPRVVAFHKPRGVLVSRVRELGAAVVFDLLPEELQAFFCVGRLDKGSEGLLLLCDDARLAQRMMDPGGLAKRYVVTVRGLLAEPDLERLCRGGIELDGRRTRPLELRCLGRAPRGGTRYEVVLHEGLNRQIRRLLAQAGCRVRRLVRVAVGPVELEDLPPVACRELPAAEVRALLEALGDARWPRPAPPRGTHPVSARISAARS